MNKEYEWCTIFSTCLEVIVKGAMSCMYIYLWVIMKYRMKLWILRRVRGKENERKYNIILGVLSIFETKRSQMLILDVPFWKSFFFSSRRYCFVMKKWCRVFEIIVFVSKWLIFAGYFSMKKVQRWEGARIRLVISVGYQSWCKCTFFVKLWLKNGKNQIHRW